MRRPRRVVKKWLSLQLSKGIDDMDVDVMIVFIQDYLFCSKGQKQVKPGRVELSILLERHEIFQVRQGFGSKSSYTSCLNLYHAPKDKAELKR
jgi:hypothetical protein